MKPFPTRLPLPGGVLALDIARNTGWCYIGPTPDCGLRAHVWELPSRSMGAGPQGCAFENRLIEEINRREPKMLVYEAPLSMVGSGNTNRSTVWQAFGLSQLAECTAYRHDLPVRSYTPGHVRSEVMGVGAGRISSQEKQGGLIVRWLWDEFGITANGHDAADAILLAIYAAHISGRPLYEGKRKWTR